jgi:hypothetical protein
VRGGQPELVTLVGVQPGNGQGIHLDRLQVRRVKPRPGKQDDPAVATAFCIDRHSRCRQLLDVTQHSAARHLKPLGELGCRHAVTGLQKQQQAEQPGRLHSLIFPE